MTSSVDMAARTSIDPPRWQPVGPLDVGALAKARSEIINLIQWPARIANCYVAAAAPEERIVLEFRPRDAAFMTKTFAHNLSVELRLPTLEMQFRENGKAVPHIFDPEERSPAEVEAWLLVELLHRGVDRAIFSKKLPYNIPDPMTGDAVDHSPGSCQQGLTQLAVWFRNAAAACEIAALASGAKTAGVVCWPQTLALSIDSAGADFGFSPGDAQHQEPYFFRKRPITKGRAAGKAHSILAASELLAERDPAAAAIAFMTNAAS